MPFDFTQTGTTVPLDKKKQSQTFDFTGGAVRPEGNVFDFSQGTQPQAPAPPPAPAPVAASQPYQQGAAISDTPLFKNKYANAIFTAPSRFAEQALHKLSFGLYPEPKPGETLPEKAADVAGRFTGEVLPFVASYGTVGKAAEKALSTAPKLVRIAGKGAASSAVVGGTQAAVEGKEPKEIAKEAAKYGALGAVGDVALEGIVAPFAKKALGKVVKPKPVAEMPKPIVEAPRPAAMAEQAKPKFDFTAKAEPYADVAERAANWKDKPKLLLKRETMERNFEDIMGADAPAMKAQFLDPIHKAESDRIRWLNKERSEIASLGIKPRSKDSALLQQFGEGKITEEQLKQATPNWQGVMRANQVLREKYDRYLNEINTVITRNGYDPIPRRKDYFVHFQEISDVLEKYGIPVKDNVLPTDINGLTADFRPGKNFFTSALKRKGDKTTFDAIQGIDRYVDGASKLIYQTDNIQRLRGLDAALRQRYAGTDHLANLAAELTEFTNILAGKKAMMDRAAEDLVGRVVYGTVDRLRKQVSANMVGSNVASSLTNFIPLTQSLATTSKPAFIKGVLDTIANVFVDDGLVSRSDFLTRRIGSDRLAMTLWDNVQNKAWWLFKVMDNFTSQVIVRGKYLEGMGKGLNDAQALKQADEWAARILADRSIGSMPTLFGSKTLGLVTQFQLEVNNQLSFMFKDIPQNYNVAGAASAIGQVFLYGYLFNNLYETAVGRRPAFDPIYIAEKAYQDYANQNLPKGAATQNLIRNIADPLPFAGILTGGRIPMGAAVPNVLDVATGKADAWQELQKPLIYLLPPAGGGQVRKTLQGLGAYGAGGAFNRAGTQLYYPVEQTPANWARAALFGKSAFPETQEYYEQGRKPLGTSQTKEVMRSANPKARYQSIIKRREEERKKKKGR